MTCIAIIGAGLAGLTAAKSLNNYADVTVFEKARSVSGRMATRRAQPYFFDHGAQFFTAQTSEFKTLVSELIEEGVVSRWDARFVEIENQTITKKRLWDAGYPHYVGVPGMSAIGKHLSQGIKIELETHIQTIEKIGEKWRLTDNTGNILGEFDWVLSAIPAEQAANILPSSLSFHQEIKSVQMEGCFSLMLGFENPLPLEFDAALVRGEYISWISVNGSKPERDGGFGLLVHSTNSWADDHRDDDREQVMDYLCKKTSMTIGHDVCDASHKVLHKWGYANAKKRSLNTHLINVAGNIGVCGDWLIQGRAEAAFTSGRALADDVLETLDQT